MRLLMVEFDCPEVTLTVQLTVQLLTHCGVLSGFLSLGGGER